MHEHIDIGEGGVGREAECDQKQEQKQKQPHEASQKRAPGRLRPGGDRPESAPRPGPEELTVLQCLEPSIQRCTDLPLPHDFVNMRPSIVLARSVRAATSAAAPSVRGQGALLRPALLACSSSSPASSSSSSSKLPARARTSTVAGRRGFFSLPDISKLASLVPGESGANDGDEQRFHARKVFP